MPVETFREPLTAQTGKSASVPAADTSSWTGLLSDTTSTPQPAPEAYATVSPIRPAEPSNRIQQHARHAATLLTGSSASAASAPTQAQPRPKPKTSEKKTLREILGLKPRKQLNWWQRIHWSLKASVPVILVAVVFALLKINLLAIIFGLLGAYLLIRGLKKEFKVRRPWF